MLPTIHRQRFAGDEAGLVGGEEAHGADDFFGLAEAATTSGVWYDEDTSALSAEKRTNRIKLKRDPQAADSFDA